MLEVARQNMTHTLTAASSRSTDIRQFGFNPRDPNAAGAPKPQQPNPSAPWRQGGGIPAPMAGGRPNQVEPIISLPQPVPIGSEIPTPRGFDSVSVR